MPTVNTVVVLGAVVVNLLMTLSECKSVDFNTIMTCCSEKNTDYD